MTQLILATRNRHKVGEIQSILGDAFSCVSMDQLGESPALIEDAETFEQNAARKAEQLARWLTSQPSLLGDLLAANPETWVVADDSGLEVDFLGGAPGVHSARFAQTGADRGNAGDADNNAKLLRLLQGAGDVDRSARFRCVLCALKLTNTGYSSPQFHEGKCEGRIDRRPRGQRGFGYDPLFVPEGYDQSFAELGDSVKNRLSHRYQALEALRKGFGADSIGS